MGWLREKFKNIESKIDEIGGKIETSMKQEKQKNKEDSEKRKWKNLKWYQKLALILFFVFSIIFWIIVGPLLWKLLCRLWQLFIGYCIWKQATG